MEVAIRESSSFLKKRTKKPLGFGVGGHLRRAPRGKSFCGFFQKEALFCPP
jgi:hypothetical protein